MSQAATLNARQLQQVLDYCRTRRHALRDRTMILVSHWSGMRVKEIAALRWCDVVNSDGTIKAEIRLSAEQTKGRHPRTVFLPEKLRSELAHFVEFRRPFEFNQPFFTTASGKGFTANVLTQHFFWLFRNAGIAGASSHTMRRSFITNLANKGVGVRVLASLAGHKGISVIQRYIDVNTEMMRRAVELI